MFYTNTYQEIRGYRLQDMNRIQHPAKENWYALAISIIKGYTVDYSLSRMGVNPQKRPYARKKTSKYQEVANIAYIIHTICGFGYNDTAKLLNKSWSIIRDAVAFAQGQKRVRHNASRRKARYQAIVQNTEPRLADGLQSQKSRTY